MTVWFFRRFESVDVGEPDSRSIVISRNDNRAAGVAFVAW